MTHLFLISEHQFIINELSTYGPWAVFILLLIPLFGEDMIIIPAGIVLGHDPDGMTSQMICSYAAASYAGVLVSDFLWYWIGYHYGTPVLHKRWFKRLAHPRRLLEAKHHIERKGAWVIVVARFIPGSRTTAITMAGMLHMPFWKFTLAEICCVIFTVPLQLGVGILLGRGFGGRDTIDLVWALIGGIMVVVAVMAGIGWWRKHRKMTIRPRAKAIWLRRFRVPHIRPPRKPTKA